MNRRALIAAPAGLLMLLLLTGCGAGQDPAGSSVATTVAGSRPPTPGARRPGPCHVRMIAR
jgi:hypothetical protein